MEGKGLKIRNGAIQNATFQMVSPREHSIVDNDYYEIVMLKYPV
jgi:hypothetical protein